MYIREFGERVSPRPQIESTLVALMPSMMSLASLRPMHLAAELFLSRKPAHTIFQPF